MQQNALLESASFLIEIGKNEIELVSGGTEVIAMSDYDGAASFGVCPGCMPPPPPKIAFCPGCTPPPPPK